MRKSLKLEKKPPEPYREPPEHLSERSRELWRTLGPDRVTTVGRQTLFQAALESLDRADEARRLVEGEGLTSTTPATGAVHLHPAVKVEREARAQFAKLWVELGLDSVPMQSTWHPVKFSDDE